MTPENVLVARMGQIKTGSGGDLLKATLGSCIGIAFLWKKAGLCGLAHCLLPESKTPVEEIGARYVSQAIPSLIHLMGIRKPEYRDIEAVITGGANMMNIGASAGQVGTLNAEAAQRLMSATGIRIVHLDIGGNRGRQIVVDCADYHYSIKEIAAQT